MSTRIFDEPLKILIVGIPRVVFEGAVVLPVSAVERVIAPRGCDADLVGKPPKPSMWARPI